MTAILNLNGHFSGKQLHFTVADKPTAKWPGVSPTNIESLQLDGSELEYAQNELGAARVNKPGVTYFGDEARRILFNW